ncbi:MAG: ribbon-helix-helix protein, CopG family [Bryobacteraceae bacterium]|nr:ribbon-helix-helix protein, CopG family [Bryobacteraceae bacterium]
MTAMRGITIKLPEDVAGQLRQQAREGGLSVAALMRERNGAPSQTGGSAYAVSAGFAGSLAGSRRPATNARRKFRRS